MKYSMKDGARMSMLTVMALLILFMMSVLEARAESVDVPPEINGHIVESEGHSGPKDTAMKGASGAGALIWHDYATGMAVAAQTDKPLVIHFTADWCHWCRVMQRDTYAHPEVMAFLRDTFVAARVDADRNQRLRAEYAVQGLPTVWFLTADGQPITYVPGYIDGPTFLQVLRWIESGAYREQSFADFKTVDN